MAVEFARVDDRLLHGQVCVTWIRELSIEQCIVVSDEIAADSLQRSVLELAAPAGFRVAFFGPEQFAAVAKTNPVKRRTMLLFRQPSDVLRLLRAGYPLTALNIGGMKPASGRQPVSRAVAVSPAEAQELREIQALGCAVELRMIPRENALPLDKALEKLR